MPLETPNSAPLVAVASPKPSGFGPLKIALFRDRWIASTVSSVGTWMQDTAGTWLMTSLTASPLLIALMQTAASLPVLLLGLLAGATADIFDRRKLLIFWQAWMLASVGVLAVLTFIGYVSPWALLAFTFLLNIGSAMNNPAWQAIVPEFCPSRVDTGHGLAECRQQQPSPRCRACTGRTDGRRVPARPHGRRVCLRAQRALLRGRHLGTGQLEARPFVQVGAALRANRRLYPLGSPVRPSRARPAGLPRPCLRVYIFHFGHLVAACRCGAARPKARPSGLRHTEWLSRSRSGGGCDLAPPHTRALLRGPDPRRVVFVQRRRAAGARVRAEPVDHHRGARPLWRRVDEHHVYDQRVGAARSARVGAGPCARDLHDGLPGRDGPRFHSLGFYCRTHHHPGRTDERCVRPARHLPLRLPLPYPARPCSGPHALPAQAAGSPVDTRH